MKNIYVSRSLGFLGFMLCALSSLWSQQAIPNGNFEEWSTQSISTPTGYVNSHLERPEYAFLGTCLRVNDAQNGTYAIRLTTKKPSASADEQPGYFANLVDGGNGEPNTWHGGFPISEKPTGIKGYYKHDVMVGDSAFILVIFSKNGVNIGSYFYFVSGKQSTYTEFNYTFSPALTQTPDSMIFGAVSSNVFNEVAVEGSMLQLDNVTLTGVVNQPALLNGNFENWTNIDIESPKNWNVESQERTKSVKSTDKYKGTYGIKLESYLSIDGSFTKVQESIISNGYYTQGGNDGGFPFSNTNDTLLFWYKYTTPGNSKAIVYITYKKAGSIIGGRALELDVWNSNYKYVSFPIEVSAAPDTLIVSFFSLRNDVDKSNLANAGSILYLDEVQLTSQRLTTGIRKVASNNRAVVYPNPAADNLNIVLSDQILAEEVSLTILDQLGREVLTKRLEQAETRLSLEGINPGLYTYILSSKETIFQSSRLLIQD
jgi:hypothetical protein